MRTAHPTIYQLSTINYQLSIDRERGRSHYNYQLKSINSRQSKV
ncbi:MAG: hypothetical protein ACRC62_01195 [Microcoleus sp.]